MTEPTTTVSLINQIRASRKIYEAALERIEELSNAELRRALAGPRASDGTVARVLSIASDGTVDRVLSIASADTVARVAGLKSLIV
ncbi:MAG: hypothetical protein RLZZ373_426, partial [Pseudomonadota bacterium]